MAKTLRYEYPGDEFAGAFVEVSGSWTRRELREWMRSDGDTFIDLLKRKVTAVNLCHITDPAQFSDDALDDLPNELFEWLVGVVSVVYVEVNRLGEASRRLALRMLETETQAAESPPQTN